jgi:hypothetical protein
MGFALSCIYVFSWLWLLHQFMKALKNTKQANKIAFAEEVNK